MEKRLRRAFVEGREAECQSEGRRKKKQGVDTQMALAIVLPCLAPRDPPEFVSVKTDKAKSSDL